MKEPLLSVVIISLENPSLVLQRAIRSVYEQSYHNCEIILVDANEPGSDYSAGLREDMEAYPDISVIAYPADKKELAGAKNRGAAEAKGSYLSFLMGEDAWNQECAARQIEVLEKHSDVALVFCNLWFGNGDVFSREYQNEPQPLWEDVILEGTVLENPIRSMSQVMFRKSCFDEMNGFDTKISRQDEYDMWLRLMKKYKIASLGRNLVCSYVEKRVLRKSHRMRNVVGYLQLYSKHEELYKKNTKARLELYRRIAESYKEAHCKSGWMRYLWKIKTLEIWLSLSAGNKKQ